MAASRLAELKERKASMQESLEQQAKTEWGETPLKAWQVVKEVMEVAGPNAVVVEECVTAAESVRAFGALSVGFLPAQKALSLLQVSFRTPSAPH